MDAIARQNAAPLRRRNRVAVIGIALAEPGFAR